MRNEQKHPAKVRFSVRHGSVHAIHENILTSGVFPALLPLLALGTRTHPWSHMARAYGCMSRFLEKVGITAGHRALKCEGRGCKRCAFLLFVFLSRIVPRDERGRRLDFGFNLCVAPTSRVVSRTCRGESDHSWVKQMNVVDIQTEEIQNEVDRIYKRNQLR